MPALDQRAPSIWGLAARIAGSLETVWLTGELSTPRAAIALAPNDAADCTRFAIDCAMLTSVETDAVEGDAVACIRLAILGAVLTSVETDAVEGDALDADEVGADELEADAVDTDASD